jgi:alpha-beta hydrolase superfamily lysophospholipase
VATRTITFASKDGLVITADEYSLEEPKAYILLCHRSHFNRGEYREIAPRLNSLGYSCLAVDLRSGMKVLGTINETYARAKEQGKPTGYLEAKPDIEAALEHIHKLSGKPVILFGSSYSASLALLLASEGNQNIAAVVAFSPGEYLKGIELSEAVAKITIPTLVLSARQEVEATSILLKSADPQSVEQYIPEGEGAHGARVLWAKTAGSKDYWVRVSNFLQAHQIPR